MKMFLRCLALFVLAAVIYIPASFAGNSGNERVVEVIEYKCVLCGVEVYTFAPDDIDADSKNDYKQRDYQLREWFLLTDYSRPFLQSKQCKTSNDAHLFDKKSSSKKIPPAEVARLKDKFIVLKNGYSLSTKIQELKCLGCGKSIFDFVGDDMDLYGVVDCNKSQNVWSLKGSAIGDCNKVQLAGVQNVKPHLLRVNSEGSRNSYDIAKNLSIFYYSN